MRVRRVRKVSAMGMSGGVASDKSVRAGTAPTADNLIVITPEFDVIGSICIDARVRLEAIVDGEIRCTALEVTREAQVRGRIVAETVTIYGTVTAGSIYANVLVLKPGCSVEAEIFHEHLQLETGSYFDGKSRRVSNPTSLAPQWGDKR